VDIPILITGMSYGGALSLEAKQALARGASLAGTATNSGEAPLIPEERKEARAFIGQYNRGEWLNDEEQLSQVDAIEIQLGQGAQAAAPQSTPAWMTGPTYRKYFDLEPGQKATIDSRLPGVDSPEDLIRLVKDLRERYGVPVGLKTAATHHLEDELDIALQAGVDYVVVDGAEGGTHGGATILQDDVGLPTLYALARSTRHLERRGKKGDVSVIASGGLFTPGHFAKALALGADAVYIGTIALMALQHTQMNKALPVEPATQMLLYTGRYHEDLDIDEAARNLARFLQSCVREMELMAYALGKTALRDLDRSDLCSVDAELARALSVDYAAYPRREQPRHPRRAKAGIDGAVEKTVVAQAAAHDGQVIAPRKH